VSSPHRPVDLGTPEPIALVARLFAEAAGPALTSRLRRPVTVAVLGVEPAGDLAARLPLPWLCARAGYARGLAGAHHVIVAGPGALALGRALAGEAAGEAAELSAAHGDAVRDAVGQVAGALASALTAHAGRPVGFQPVTAQVVADASAVPAELGVPGERGWLVRLEATAADGFRAELALTAASELAAELGAASAERAGSTASGSRRADGGTAGIDLILDVTLPVAVELGRARMQIQDILKLAPGSIVELDKAAGDPVEILINDRPIARGEVVVIDENFGVRLTSIVTPAERIRTLR
jgi:flagellar motor switch protein FliN/FliY